MTFCSNCGKETTPGAAYCIHCGARLGTPPVAWREWSRTRRLERGDGSGRLGLVSAFGILIIIGLTISNYPDVFRLVNIYFESWATRGYPVLPGFALGQAIVFFLTACGIWGMVVACLRFAFTNKLSRPMRDVVGALFSLYVANLFTQYYGGLMAGSALVLAFFVGLGVVIVANAAIAVFVPRHIVTTTSTV